MLVSSGVIGGVTAEYVPAAEDDAFSAYVRMCFNGTDAGAATVFLDIEDVRYLAEVLPGLLMAHDAAEHAAAERDAIQAEAA
ncbi:hypothetical protein AB0L63_10510 [Nocardia sp. NPDC051990]|uniref:hypothetical protein n=1 Tax=Nocardia sp. NPDC051990 TaxID=3155285 RepID=UPI0034341ECC